MPLDLLFYADGRPRINADLLYLPFFERVLDVLQACRARGADFFVTYGFRSYDEQKKLYQAHLAGGPLAAPPGFSAHNYGLAVDLTRDASSKPGLQPTWDEELYKILGEEAPKVGLVWGGTFHEADRPHLNWPGYLTTKQLSPLLHTWNATKGSDLVRLKAVWNTLDRKDA